MILAGVFYSGGLLIAIYFSIIMFAGRTFLTASELIFAGMSVCIPLILATFLLASSVEAVDKRFKIMKYLLIVIFIFYNILLVSVLFRNGYRQFRATSVINLIEELKWKFNYIPFKTIKNYIQAYNNGYMGKSIIAENLLGNTLLFAPMGILLTCLFPSLHKFIKFIVVMLIVLISVELGQLLTGLGSCDIDDIILNLSGAILFYGVWNIRFMQLALKKVYVLK
ncbi:MAG TPA: VanZ family protein [Clostridiaceae bacterium]